VYSYSPEKILGDLNILYVEDEDNIRENISSTLSRLVKKVVSCANFDDAQNILGKEHIDIFILDITINDNKSNYKNGLAFAKYIKEQNHHSEIIIISAHSDKDYLLESIKISISDYLLKPINYKDLKNALLKCTQNILDSASYITIFPNNYIYNRQKQYVQDEKEEIIHLTSNEIKLLNYLIENHNIVVSKEMLLNYIWNDEFIEGAHLKVLVNKLRSKIGKESILTLSGLGYRIVLQDMTKNSK
jgi:DNA-binding response OmpR family regulator